MLQIKKIFYTFAVVLIALVITPNAAMRVSACDDHITLSDKLADITPSFVEIDFYALLADAVQDRYEEELFIVISMQEGQVDVVSVEVVNEERLRLLAVYAGEDADLLLIVPLSIANCCRNPKLERGGDIYIFCPVRLTWVWVSILRCVNCGNYLMPILER